MKKSRKIAFTVGTLLAAVLLTALTFGERGFLDMHRLYRADRIRAAEIEAARAEVDSLKREIERLKNDTLYIERIAREKLGMAKKGEKIFKFVDEE